MPELEGDVNETEQQKQGDNFPISLAYFDRERQMALNERALLLLNNLVMQNHAVPKGK